MLDELRLARLLVVLTFLIYACKLDLESRIVPNRVWKYMLIASLPLTIIEALHYNTMMLAFAVIQLVVTVALAYALYLIGAYGGADAKAIMSLAAIFPLYPSFDGFPIFGIGGGMFALATLANSVLAAPFLLAAMFLRNVFRLGLRNIKGNLLYYFVAYRVSIDEIPKFHNLLEYIDESGNLVRVKRGIEPSEELLSRLKRGGVREVWVTPALPFLLFITAGYTVAFVVGDVLFLIVSALLH